MDLLYHQTRGGRVYCTVMGSGYMSSVPCQSDLYPTRECFIDIISSAQSVLGTNNKHLSQILTEDSSSGQCTNKNHNRAKD